MTPRRRRAARPEEEKDPRVAAVRAGDPDLAARLGPVLAFMRALWALEHGLNSRSKAMNRKMGVTGPQRLVLRVIAQLGPLSQKQLAAVLHLHPASVTRLARGLQARRMLRRRVDPADRRRLVLEIGPAAGRVSLPAAGTVEAAVREALAGASDVELTAAFTLIARLSECLHR